MNATLLILVGRVPNQLKTCVVSTVIYIKPFIVPSRWYLNLLVQKARRTTSDHQRMIFQGLSMTKVRFNHTVLVPEYLEPVWFISANTMISLSARLRVLQCTTRGRNARNSRKSAPDNASKWRKYVLVPRPGDFFSVHNEVVLWSDGRSGFVSGQTTVQKETDGGSTWPENHPEFVLFKIRGLSVLLSSFVFFGRGERCEIYFCRRTEPEWVKRMDARLLLKRSLLFDNATSWTHSVYGVFAIFARDLLPARYGRAQRC